MTYEGKILCDRCEKPIGEKIKLESGEVHHQPYINYRKWRDIEICNLCLLEIKQYEARGGYNRRGQGIK